jgi:hypothetical protein
MRYLIGMIVSAIAVLAVTVLEIASHVEIIERSIPEWLVPMINEKVNFALIAVAILIFIAAYFDYKIDKRKDAHSPFHKNGIQPAAPQDAMPQPAVAGVPFLVAFPLADSKPNRLTHNVRFIGLKRIQLIRDVPDMALATLCFENSLIAGQEILDFHLARLRVDYSDPSTGEKIAEAFLARWNESPDAPIDILGSEKKYAIIASCLGSKWTTDSLIDVPVNPALEYGFGGSEYKRSHVPLPLGRIKINATLIGARNLSIPPVEGILTLGEDGSVSFIQDAKMRPESLD